MKESGERTDRSTSRRTFRLIPYSALFLELLCAPDLLVQEALPFGGFCKACVCAGGAAVGACGRGRKLGSTGKGSLDRDSHQCCLKG